VSKRIDHQICIDALVEARRLLSEYIEPGSAHDAVATLEHILEVLDNRDVDAALGRISERQHFELVTPEYYGPPEDVPENQ
jgi:hypothetical protein